MSQESTTRVPRSRQARNAEGVDFTSSLDSYLSSVGRLGQVDANEQLALVGAIDDARLELESLLSGFGFVALEYCRALEVCCNTGSSPEDFFLSSSLRRGADALPPRLSGELRRWLGEIRKAHAKLEDAFRAGAACANQREALSALLKKFRLNGMILDELCRTAAGYEELNPGLSGQLEERFLMNEKELRAALDALKAARDRLDALNRKMAEANLRLVICIAGKYRESAVPMNDLIQEGNLGLMVAVQRFDFRLGNKFSTYAGWWIKHYILRALAEQSRVIRLPRHMIQAIQNMNKAEQRFIQTEGREPEIEELAAVLEMPLARVSALRKMAAQSISLQAAVDPEDENGTTLEERIGTGEKDEPWRSYAQKLLNDRLNEMLNTLPERERQIIVYRFGLCGETPLPSGEISARLNLSRERVRQLENKVLAQLRSQEYLKFIDGLSHLDD